MLIHQFQVLRSLIWFFTLAAVPVVAVIAILDNLTGSEIVNVPLANTTSVDQGAALTVLAILESLVNVTLPPLNVYVLSCRLVVVLTLKLVEFFSLATNSEVFLSSIDLQLH